MINYEFGQWQQIDIFGKLLPSSSSIESVLAECSTEEDKQGACLSSNFLIAKFSRVYTLAVDIFNDDMYVRWFNNIQTSNTSMKGLYTELWFLMKHQCLLTGDDFTHLIQSQFTEDWYFSMFGGDSGNDLQGLERSNKNILKVMYGEKPVEVLDKYKNRYRQTYRFTQGSILDRFRDYLQARIAIKTFGENVDKLLDINEQNMASLYMGTTAVFAEIYKLGQKIKKDIPDSNKHIYYCPFCKSRYIVDGGKLKKSCESLECDREYSSSTTKKSREQPSATNKIINPAPFVRIDNIRRWCQGECNGKRRRLVNEHARCKPCHIKGL